MYCVRSNVSICLYLGFLYKYRIFIYIIYNNPYLFICPGKLNCIVIYYDLILFSPVHFLNMLYMIHNISIIYIKLWIWYMLYIFYNYIFNIFYVYTRYISFIFLDCNIYYVCYICVIFRILYMLCISWIYNRLYS